MLPRLVEELQERLACLDCERARISAALTVLNDEPSPTVRRRRPTLDKRITDALRANPGMRASMLAEVERVPADVVLSRLEGMQQAGRVAREGLGWRLAVAEQSC